MLNISMERKTLTQDLLPLFVLFTAAILTATALPAQAQSVREFSIPLQQLKTWSEQIVVDASASITGHSAVHPAASDCEMHMGGKLTGYKGTPEGWVLEPMNLCLELMPSRGINKKKDWETELGDKVTDKTVQVRGVPRIWPEHLDANPKDEDSNPSHTMELHPLVRLVNGGDSYDFSSFIYAPEGFPGVKTKTSRAMLTQTKVKVRTNADGMVDVSFDSIRMIGNFAQLQITIERGSITEQQGSHFMDGVAVAETEDPTGVRLIT